VKDKKMSEAKADREKTVNEINHMILYKGYCACNTKIKASGIQMLKRELVKIGNRE
jgi:hypothetical protein